MDKKYFLTGGTNVSSQTTVDLKKTQIELLKANNKLKKINIKDKESILKGYEEVFNAIQPISNYLKKLKKEEMPNMGNTLFNTSDKMLKLLNKDEFNNYEFKYKKLQKVIPPLKLDKIKFRDIDFDSSLHEKTYQEIKDNKRSLTINLKPNSIPTIPSINKKEVIPIVFTPKKISVSTYEKDYESEFIAINTFLDTIPDISVSVDETGKEDHLNRLIIELQERIIEIKEFITLLELPLNLKKIKDAVQSLKRKNLLI